ncbi:phosphopantetheine-binding protein [Streptomyces sp. NPDC056503]|uniref:phosphopantetheine-binding protein n=1 Tax=Streptomyces sp. NPDC056503 TaxID=3345842 RepID=UPI0036A34EA8
MWDPEFEEILREHLPYVSPAEELSPESDLPDLGLDSMGVVELMTVLEGAYGVRFRDEALSLDSFRSPGVLWRTLTAMRAPV